MGDPFEVDEVDIVLAPAGGADEEGLKAEIESSIQAAIEVKPNSVSLLPLDELVERLRSESGMKEVRVVDRRPEAPPAQPLFSPRRYPEPGSVV